MTPSPASASSRRPIAIGVTAGVLAFLLVAGGVALLRHSSSKDPGKPPGAGPTATAQADDLVYQRLANPARTVVRDHAGALVASFTDGSRTVRLRGAKRTFAEPEFTTATVTTDAWIRLAPHAWTKGAETADWFASWLAAARTDTTADVLAVAVQYLKDAPELVDANGVRYAGDAEFGPTSTTDPDGRAENSDFQDYLGIPWDFPDKGTVAPKKSRYGDVDCSGFLRLVYGYRMGYPLLGTNDPGDGIPRRAYAISTVGPGTEVIPNRGRAVRDYDLLQPGDLVFFDLDGSDGDQIDHSGIFLGVDNAGHYRFISSRTRANGPTFGDKGYVAILDGGGHFSSTFRNARRL